MEIEKDNYVDFSIIGKRLKNLIKKSEYKTQEAFAWHVPGKGENKSMSVKTLSLYCTGKLPIPYNQALVFSRLLKCPVEYLQDDGFTCSSIEEYKEECSGYANYCDFLFYDFLGTLGVSSCRFEDPLVVFPVLSPNKADPDTIPFYADKGIYDKYPIGVCIDDHWYELTEKQMDTIKKTIQDITLSTLKSLCPVFDADNKKEIEEYNKNKE